MMHRTKPLPTIALAFAVRSGAVQAASLALTLPLPLTVTVTSADGKPAVKDKYPYRAFHPLP